MPALRTTAAGTGAATSKRAYHNVHINATYACWANGGQSCEMVQERYPWVDLLDEYTRHELYYIPQNRWRLRALDCQALKRVYSLHLFLRKAIELSTYSTSTLCRSYRHFS